MINEEEIITASDDRSLRIWNAHTGKCNRVFYHSKKLQNVHCSKKKELICIYDEENRVMVLDHMKLKIMQGWSIGKKIMCSEGKERLYFGVSNQVSVFSWHGVKLFSHSFEVTFIPGSML
jgi:WD40 repeat protein